MHCKGITQQASVDDILAVGASLNTIVHETVSYMQYEFSESRCCPPPNNQNVGLAPAGPGRQQLTGPLRMSVLIVSLRPFARWQALFE